MATPRNEGMGGAGALDSVLSVAMVLPWVLEPTHSLLETLRSEKQSVRV